MVRFFLLPILLLPLLAVADPSIDRARLDTSGIGYDGVLSVNQAAGDFQQQSNARAIAIGPGASASTGQSQRLQVRGIDRALDAGAEILGPAFTGGSGVLGVNQSAGAATQQANAMSISLGAVTPRGLDDNELSQSVAVTNFGSGGAAAIGARRVVTDDQAFAGSNGVVQLNQSAGVGNRMANTLSIRVADQP
ncbi:hypothetical protein D9M68_255920 [compost metagenome]